ncbi:glycosyltransferase [Emticicia sp. ODNR4P]|nr:glycosyltransferase [Emticicia sp. ODNR4P]
MDILVNASILSRKPTGLGNVAIKAINSLPRKERITICTSTREYFNGFEKIIEINQVSQAGKSKFSGLFRFWWNQVSLTLLGRSYDYVYSPTHHGSLFLKNQIITIHDLIVFKFPHIHRLQWLYFRLTLPIFIKNSPKIIVISECVKKDILFYFPSCDPDKIIVIKNSFDSSIYNTVPRLLSRKTHNVEQKYILAVGATYSHKNLEILLDFCSVRRAEGTLDFKVYIVGGDSSYRQALKIRAKENRLEEVVDFLGYVSNDELVTLYQNAFCLVYPSLYEGFGLPIVEALACGCPVIASDLEVFKEVCPFGALFFETGNLESFSKCYSDFEQWDDNQKKEFLTKGIDYLKDYTWEDTGKKIFSLLSNIR